MPALMDAFHAAAALRIRGGFVAASVLSRQELHAGASNILAGNGVYHVPVHQDRNEDEGAQLSIS